MKKNNSSGWHILLLHMSALLFGGTALFSKILPMGAADIIFFRSLFSCAILLFVLVIFTPRKLQIHSAKDLLYVALSGLLFGIHLWTYFYAIQVSSVGIGVISLFTFPMITTLVEPIILKTFPKRKDVLLGLIVLVGVSFIVSESKYKSSELHGVGLGILSALSYSLRNLVQKYRLSAYSPLSMLFYQLLITGFLMVSFTSFEYSEISSTNYSYLIVLSILFTIIPHVAVMESLKTFDARSVSLILTLQVFYAILFSFLLFGEELKFSIFIGALLVIFSVGYETVRMRRKQ